MQLTFCPLTEFDCQGDRPHLLHQPDRPQYTKLLIIRIAIAPHIFISSPNNGK
ncbi:MAG: hypothetical protein JGK38_17685 [Microcoleus sp. PH2017_15_JOR_U_A]|uniref:hypothetical protein n=1 Tax=Microcoleus sp. PH2017_15_JOR_U_A TaxID=2798826 RepID=UPI001D7B7685|nr:hypothetical protein [Microcoleus sp. PH2017_15_JOR_U_A]MCC3498427.1 hypothetical protein [Microcoleus sp. PH2017_15_JOR_U_A]